MKKDKTKTILIIEDDTQVRQFAVWLLELEGFHILQAVDGDEGLRLAREQMIALVLLDLRLPGRDGWSLLEEIKGDTNICNIPVIVFTASVGVDSRDKALCMGAADYLTKPLSAASLRNSISRILER